jgi:outer membrane protein assembly factor BamE (lipoprotein component of BamABCDE complex)
MRRVWTWTGCAGAARLTLALALASAIGGCVSLSTDSSFSRGYVVDQQTIDKIKVGASTKPQILADLGTPSTTSTIGGDAWYYIGQKMWRPVQFMAPRVEDQNVLAIYFGKSGKVERIANYGLKDGEVFDYVSRTTPTGGAEPDFLRNMLHSFLVFG